MARTSSPAVPHTPAAVMASSARTTTLGVPMTCLRPGLGARTIAYWTGRREGRRPTSESGHTPYTRQLHHRSEISEARIDQWLHDVVTPIDSEVLRICSTIAHRTSTAGELGDTIKTLGEPAGDDVTAIRNLRRYRASITRHKATLAAARDAYPRLVELLGQRQHQLDQARAAAGAEAAACEVLVMAHRHGFESRRDQNCVTQRPPRYRCRSVWVTGDLPLLVATIDARTAHVVTWAMRGFHPGGPFPEESD